MFGLNVFPEEESPKLFPLIQRDGTVMFISARQLHNRILKDSLVNFNWVATAQSLVAICNCSDFPRNIAAEIKDAMLRSFVEQAACGLFYPEFHTPTDELAMFSCYASSKDEELREIFLSEIVRHEITIAKGEAGEIWFNGPCHQEFDEKFIETQLKHLAALELASKKEAEAVDYVAWRKGIQKEYCDAHNKAEEDGEFEEDYKITEEILTAMQSGTPEKTAK
ncbi:hypothetical protein J6Z37_00115 [Candidatus Saccharibacteria bacterium]|nr:hypothetical protein [Candidatus Saccharibacteria bacterium]